MKDAAIIVVGEIYVDFAMPRKGAESKLRLGGVVHAARGLWAADMAYAVAAFCPGYLVELAKIYLSSHGCEEFIWLGEITGSPNVVAIADPMEVSSQGYEDLLREEKSVRYIDAAEHLKKYTRAVVFPGKYSFDWLEKQMAPGAQVSFDVAYDVTSFSQLLPFKGRIGAIIISTSSRLFADSGSRDVGDLLGAVKTLSPEVLLLKENRGGSRLFHLPKGDSERIPATLGQTRNSVGVGDVYSSVMVAFSPRGWNEAAWRGCQAATAYSQTTYPDDFKEETKNGLALDLETMRSLGGTSLTWHARQGLSVYLAGPDFSYVEKQELERAVASLEYHNFKVRRPVQEIGELARPARRSEIDSVYARDYQLLSECSAVFAIPLDRDPGTLVEIGMAIVLLKPVITFDPRNENNNTMVVAGSHTYSAELDVCLNGLFEALSRQMVEP